MKRSRQRGAALVIAMLVVSLVATISATMGKSYLLTLKRHGNNNYREHAYLYLIAAENLARHVLHEDSKQDKADEEVRDHLGELWAQENRSFPIEGGELSVQLQDLQGLFNITSLLNDSTNSRGNRGRAVPYNAEQRIFTRLLLTYTTQSTGFEAPLLNEQQAIAVTEALVDWMDSDSDVRGFGGMEDNEYSSVGLNYRTGNRLPTSVSELLLIPPLRPIYDMLKNDITVWPLQGAGININTANERLLRCIYTGRGNQPMPQEQLSRLFDGRFRETRWGSGEVGGFPNVQAFRSASIWNNALEDIQYLEKSRFFLFSGHVDLGDLRRSLYSVLELDQEDHSVKTLTRSFIKP